MSQLSKPGPSKSRLVLVRPPSGGSRTVRAEQPSIQKPGGIYIGVITALGIIALVWLMGYLGFRLGFAMLVGVPELIGEPGAGLATGTMIVISVPRVIIAAGLSEPIWLLLGFLMISAPAGGLAAAKPVVPGGPKLNPVYTAIASTAAAAAILCSAALVWWTSSAARSELLVGLPAEPAAAEAWLNGLRTAAGLDVLAIVAAALWLVLVFRLPIPTWYRVLTASIGFFTLCVVTVAFAISAGAAAQVDMVRSQAMIAEADGRDCLIIGSTPHHTAALFIEDGRVDVELRRKDESIAVTRRESIVGFLDQRP